MRSQPGLAAKSTNDSAEDQCTVREKNRTTTQGSR